MIDRVSGRVVDSDGTSLVVDVGGVGYEINTVSSASFDIGAPVVIYTRMLLREEIPVLYGFESTVDRKSFDQLRTVQGVGPQLALTILGRLGAKGVAEAVLGNDGKLFRSVPGVGERLASRLVLEMKRFFDADDSLEGSILSQGSKGDVGEALLALGFSISEISQALKSLPADIDSENGLRLALKGLRS